MKKILTLVLTVILFIIIFTGCNNSEQALNIEGTPPIASLSSTPPTKQPTANPTAKPTAHIHQYGNWQIVSAATCISNGEKERICTCGDIKTQIIYATGHNYGEWKTTKKASCGNNGEQQRTCSCGKKETQIIIAQQHSWEDATCLQPKTCTLCGLTSGKNSDHYYVSNKCKFCDKIGVTFTFSPKNKGISCYREYSTGRIEYVSEVVVNSCTYENNRLVIKLYSAYEGTFAFNYIIKSNNTVIKKDSFYGSNYPYTPINTVDIYLPLDPGDYSIIFSDCDLLK